MGLEPNCATPVRHCCPATLLAEAPTAEPVLAKRWSTHSRLSRYSRRPWWPPLVGEAAAGECDDRHCKYGEHPYAHQGGLGRGEVQKFGHYLRPDGDVEGAVEEPDDDHAAPGTVVDPHDEDPEEHGEDRGLDEVPECNGGDLGERCVVVRDRAGDEACGHVEEREEWGHDQAGKQGPAPTLQR